VLSDDVSEDDRHDRDGCEEKAGEEIENSPDCDADVAFHEERKNSPDTDKEDHRNSSKLHNS